MPSSSPPNGDGLVFIEASQRRIAAHGFPIKGDNPVKLDDLRRDTAAGTFSPNVAEAFHAANCVQMDGKPGQTSEWQQVWGAIRRRHYLYYALPDDQNAVVWVRQALADTTRFSYRVYKMARARWHWESITNGHKATEKAKHPRRELTEFRVPQFRKAILGLDYRGWKMSLVFISVPCARTRRS